MDAWDVLKEEGSRRKYDRDFTMQLQVRTQQISCNRKLGAPHDYHIYIYHIHTHTYTQQISCNRKLGAPHDYHIYIYRYMSTHMKVELAKKRAEERFQTTKDAKEAQEKERQQKNQAVAEKKKKKKIDIVTEKTCGSGQRVFFSCFALLCIALLY